MSQVVDSASFGRGYFETSYRDYFGQNPPRKIASYVDVIRRHLPSGALLEVGCAFGLYAAELARTHRVVATDASQYAIEEARRRFADLPVEWRAGMIADLQLAEGAFDGIAAFDVLEHVPDIDGAMTDLRRALRSGGLLFVTVPVYDGPLGKLVGLLDKDPTHVHKWSRAAWRDLAAKHGFRLRECIGLFRYGGLKGGYLYFAHPSLAFASPAIFLVLEKTS